MSDTLTFLETFPDTAVHSTPNAEMRRYRGDTVAVWRTTMQPGSAGPVHTVDREQVIVVLSGELTATVRDQTVLAGPGDALLLPAGVVRQLRNEGSGPTVTLTSAVPGGRAQVGDNDAVIVPWSA